MQVSALERARHVKETITIRTELRNRSLDSLITQPLDWAGFRYLLLVISEAARHIPQDWKAQFGPDIPWRQIADLGNPIRHGYHSLDAERLWNIYRNDLGPLEAAIDISSAAPRWRTSARRSF